MYYLDNPQTSVELLKVKGEMIAISNSAIFKARNIYSDNEEDFANYNDYLKLIGTGTQLRNMKNSYFKFNKITFYLSETFLNDDYEIIIKDVKRKTIKRKARIISVKEYTPKIVIL
ncbi:hypothetical protein [Flavobacterium sp.]|uniref:hypothetical protein n=1 Tax=Flavobacterium sp. TaxID=239 RepID=UPI003752626B